ncbi:MAG: TonB family protein [Cyclobacteriaceae bacterium]
MADWKDDIEKYRNGELTSAEMHALEKKALQDPFLADALEGAESISVENFSADVNELQESIDFQSEERKVASFEMARAAAAPMAMKMAAKEVALSDEPQATSKWAWPLRIAASVVIIFCTFWVGKQLIPQAEKENLALKKEEAKPQSTTPASESVNDSALAEQKAITSSQPKSIIEKPKQLAANKPIEATPSGYGIVASPVLETEEKQTALLDVSKDKEEVREVTVEDKKAKEAIELEKTEKVSLAEPSAPLAKKDVSGYASRSQESRKKKVGGQEQFIQGQVLSAEDGTPIPGVNIVVKGTTQGTVTDVNGNYQLPVVSAEQKLTFSFIGYLTQEVPVTDQNKMDVKLGPDVSQLSEVVVTGYGYQNDSDREPVIKEAQPAGGRKAYDKYLDNSLRYPVEALTNNIKGKVTIKFTVRTDGALDEFSVVKSIGHGCDEEVIRLVKEGPKWSPTTEDNVAVESEVLVKVRFDPAKAKR